MSTKKPRPVSPNSPLHPKGWRPRPVYEPTAAELRKRMLAVQANWTEAERQRRLATPPPEPYEIPQFSLRADAQDGVESVL